MYHDMMNSRDLLERRQWHYWRDTLCALPWEAVWTHGSPIFSCNFSVRVQNYLQIWVELRRWGTSSGMFVQEEFWVACRGRFSYFLLHATTSSRASILWALLYLPIKMWPWNGIILACFNFTISHAQIILFIWEKMLNEWACTNYIHVLIFFQNSTAYGNLVHMLVICSTHALFCISM
jgi:hypothetical protein